MAKKRNSQHKRNTEEVTMSTKTEIESNTDKETSVENNGITIINMKPRSSRDKHNDTQEASVVDENNEPEKDDTIDINSSIAVDAIDDYSIYDTVKASDKQSESILTLTNVYDTLQTDINALNDKYDNLTSQYNTVNTDIVTTQNLVTDARTEFGNKISALYTSIDNRLVNISSFYESVDYKLSRRLNDNESKIMTESNERVKGDQLLQSSIESISNQILSITEGLDDYKSRRELLDREVSSHFDNIDGKLDKIDIDHLTTKVNNNQEISMSIQHHSILTMDFLIRISRMMVISFVSLIFTMIAMLIVIMTPSLGLKIASGIFGIICAAFVVYEAKYIISSIKKAKLSLDDLIKDSYT